MDSNNKSRPITLESIIIFSFQFTTDFCYMHCTKLKGYVSLWEFTIVYLYIVQAEHKEKSERKYN